MMLRATNATTIIDGQDTGASLTDFFANATNDLQMSRAG